MNIAVETLREELRRDEEPGAEVRDYRRIERALEWLAANYARQPTLAESAAAAGLSAHHFQRLFSRWVGVSPKKYVQYLTLERAKESLARSQSVLDAAYESGLSSPGRLHDLFVTVDAVSPGEYKSRGRGLTIRYGFQPTPFGEALFGASERGLCALAFTLGEDRRAQTLAAARSGWENARWSADAAVTGELARRVFAPPREGQPPRIEVLLRGTPFQVKVWAALLAIPPGAISTYADIAERLGRPLAARAAGRAIALNPIAYLIPCHRVIRKTGGLGGYRWGAGRKLAMLSREAARHAGPMRAEASA